jgi:hypothetical protein
MFGSKRAGPLKLERAGAHVGHMHPSSHDRGSRIAIAGAGGTNGGTALWAGPLGLGAGRRSRRRTSGAAGRARERRVHNDTLQLP